MMGANNKNRESREFIPDSLFDAGVDLEGFADDLMKQMGFADSKKPPKPSYSEHSYSYEDTGIIDKSIDHTLSMFPDAQDRRGRFICPEKAQQPAPPAAEYNSPPSLYAWDAWDVTPAVAAAERSNPPTPMAMDCFVADAPRNDGVFTQPAPLIDHEEAQQPAAPIDTAEPPKKKRFKFFTHSRGSHIRFIIIIVAVFMLEMLFIGFLESRGIVVINWH